ncbi:hypothetical protein PROFUN_07345 [Planoprotostelium fungivorum]|uniref:Transmembrane protein n=1 Tax=Planoprotostelium fungivorum TaxID=1890364 RepID=A0A2P6NLX3_9EUKA|nr:hypothetical protein PROFUN_07345 [Planoprotostelium fungivorum]
MTSKKMEIDLEDTESRFPVIVKENEEALRLAPSAPEIEEEAYHDLDTATLHEVIDRLSMAVNQAYEDENEAMAAIAELKAARRELKENPHAQAKQDRRQMRAKKAAIRLHLKYLQYTLKAHHKFSNHVAAGTAIQHNEVRKIALSLIEVFKMSHNRIQAVLAMPLHSSKQYTKSIGLRTGNTKKWLQNNPSFTATTTIGAGVLATAGLTLVIGPFSFIALAIAIPTAACLLDKQSHTDMGTLRCLRQASKQMSSRSIKKPKDVARLQGNLNYVASANRLKILPKRGSMAPRVEIDREL